MTIYTGAGLPIRRLNVLEDHVAPLSDSLGAAAEEAGVRNPTSSLLRSRELKIARDGYSMAGPLDEPDLNFDNFDPLTRLYLQDNPSELIQKPDSPQLSAKAAREKIKEEGLDLTVPDEGIPSRALDILISRKKEENKRESALSRSPEGLLPGTAKLGVALGVTLLDPLNVASAFIPVVGPARYAKLLAGASGPLGRAGIRVGVGAAEGLAGAALLEPIVYSAAHQEQADYDMSDSLMNVAFGSIFGAGLHTGSGVIKDALAWRTTRAAPGTIGESLSRSAPETREALLRASISQMVEGRYVNVEGIANLDPLFRYRSSRLQRGTALTSGVVDGGIVPFKFERIVTRGVPSSEVAKVAQSLDPASFQVAARLDQQIAQIKKKVSEGPVEIKDPDTSVRKADPEIIKAAQALHDLEKSIKAATDKRKLKRLERKRSDLISKSGGGDIKRKAEAEIRRSDAELNKAEAENNRVNLENNRNKKAFDLLEQELTELVKQREKIEPRLERVTNKAIKQVTSASETREIFRQIISYAKINNSPQSIRLASTAASRQADEVLKTSIGSTSFKEAQVELDGATEKVVSLAEKLGLDEALDELTEFDDLIDSSQAQARAIRAAALCDLRR